MEADGVCVIVGANGSGKSTLLSAIEFLKDVLEWGLDKALNLSGGSWGFTPIDSPKDMMTQFIIEIFDFIWEIMPITNPAGIYALEKIKHKKFMDVSSILKFRVSSLQRIYDDFRDKGEEDIEVFVSVLTKYQNYSNYHLWSLRKSGSLAGNETYLQSDGQNAFSVLRNWYNSKPLRERYNFVIETLRDIFPFFGDLDFESAGQTVSIRTYPPDSDSPVPIYFISNGFLTALLHLMAVCSVPDGGIVGIDEPENGLHPYAIKTIIEAFRDRAEDRNLTVLLATHSPFILNEFKEEPNRVFVMDQHQDEQLVRLDKMRDPEWLKYFALGDLYGKDFAIQEKR
jgi:predicted ATPase